MILIVRPDGVGIADAKSRDLLFFHPLNKIATWGISTEYFVINFDDEFL